MIGCDTCGRWYHGPCVGVGKAAADALDDFLCPECAGRQNKEYAFGPPLPAPKRTRRPSLHLVKALLQEAEQLAIDIPEAALISDALEQAENWQVQARQHLHDIEGEVASPSATLELYRQGEVLEVVPDLLVPVQRHIRRYEEWTEAVDELRTAPQEQKRGATLAMAAWDGLEGALSLQTQAALLCAPAGDVAKLASALTVGPRWQSAVRSALSTGGRVQIADMQHLLSSTDVHVSPEFEQLKLLVARQESLPALDDDSQGVAEYDRGVASVAQDEA